MDFVLQHIPLAGSLREFPQQPTKITCGIDQVGLVGPKCLNLLKVFVRDTQESCLVAIQLSEIKTEIFAPPGSGLGVSVEFVRFDDPDADQFLGQSRSEFGKTARGIAGDELLESSLVCVLPLSSTDVGSAKFAPARSLVVSGEKCSAMIVMSSCRPSVSARQTAVERPMTPAPTITTQG